jgi:hypothetical protein
MEHVYDVYTPNGRPDTAAGNVWNVFAPDTGGQFMPQKYTSPHVSGMY